MDNGKILFAVEDGSPSAALIKSLRNRAEKEGRGVHSVEYWAEECLTRGITALDRQFDAAIELRNTRNFAAAMSQLNPTQPDFVAQVVRLRTKYGIGGAQAQV